MHEIKKDYPKNVKITKQRTRHYQKALKITGSCH